jgi:predicted helicase
MTDTTSNGFIELIDQLDPDPKKKGAQFEHIAKWDLLNDPHYKGEFTDVWLWNDWPGRWGPDKGIDLVAKHCNGELWAVQAKAYGPDYYITYNDMAKFLAESNRKDAATERDRCHQQPGDQGRDSLAD